jgi:hypothetical protein
VREALEEEETQSIQQKMVLMQQNPLLPSEVHHNFVQNQPASVLLKTQKQRM